MATGFGTLLQPIDPRQAVDSKARLLPVAGQLKRASLLARLILSACGMRQRAMLVAGFPPATVNIPPTNNSLPVAASTVAAAPSCPGFSRPLPNADQRAPSHFAMPIAGTAPANENWPPT